MTPGERDFAASELESARDALTEGRLLLDQQLLAGAASRLYYAVFHAARAALVVRGQHSKTHSGQETLFLEAYGQAPIIDTLMKERAAADYGRDRYRREATYLMALADKAEEFVERCGAIVASVAPDEPDPPPDI